MSILFVRLTPYEPRRGCVLRRYTYRGIRFRADLGWYRVPKEVGEYLKTVHQVPHHAHSPLAFEVCTEAEAQAKDSEREAADGGERRAQDTIPVSVPEGETAPEPPPKDTPKSSGRSRSRPRK